MLNSDLDRINQMSEETIDYSDIPPLTVEQLGRMKPLRDVLPQVVSNKERITIRLDTDIIKWFREEVKHGGGGSYQALINMALRQYIKSQKEPLEETLRRVIREELQAA
jgi:uncharacterized protein (DUF4415 family)